MKASKVVTKGSLKYKFIVLQVLIVLLVTTALVGFSEIDLPFTGHQAMPENGTGLSTNAFEKTESELKQSKKLLLQKETRIKELEAELENLKSVGNNPAQQGNAANELRASLTRLESESKKEIQQRDARINELERQIQSLQNNRPSNSNNTETAALNKLRNDVQRLEARNVLLEKLNSDLKKNNEYLSERIKELQ